MKRLINDVQDVLDGQLVGLTKAHPSLTLHQDPVYVIRADTLVAGRVALLSGDGNGCEPMHCGYISQETLPGACSDEIFTSPASDKISECVIQIDGGGGVLPIIENYIGDVPSSKTTTESLHDSGVKAATMVADDDAAIKDSLYTAGRRGIVNTALTEELIDAVMEYDDSLDACVELGRKLDNQGHSIDIALGACTVSTAGKPSFILVDNGMESGVSIHGEPGVDHCPFSSLDQVADEMLDTLLENGPYHRTLRLWGHRQGSWQEELQAEQPPQSGDWVTALVNNLGVTPLSELYGVYSRLTTYYQQVGLTIECNLTGAYCTLLDMIGFSITLLKVNNETLVL